MNTNTQNIVQKWAVFFLLLPVL